MTATVLQIPRKQPIVEREPLRRLWLIAFENPVRPAWWARFLRPGFRHIRACAYYPEANQWLFFNPTLRGTVIELWQGEDADCWLGEMALSATIVLRFPSKYERSAAPMTFYCVGAIKGLLGLRSTALTPYGLYRDLLARGAEIVDVPKIDGPIIELHKRSVVRKEQ
jgi:hypothetical protein